MEPSSPKIITAVTLPVALRNKLDVEAAKQDRSRSWLTAAAIAEYLARREVLADDDR